LAWPLCSSFTRCDTITYTLPATAACICMQVYSQPRLARGQRQPCSAWGGGSAAAMPAVRCTCSGRQQQRWPGASSLSGTLSRRWHCACRRSYLRTVLSSWPSQVGLPSLQNRQAQLCTSRFDSGYGHLCRLQLPP
jgi:hypothetical protein